MFNRRKDFFLYSWVKKFVLIFSVSLLGLEKLPVMSEFLFCDSMAHKTNSSVCTSLNCLHKIVNKKTKKKKKKKKQQMYIHYMHSLKWSIQKCWHWCSEIFTFNTSQLTSGPFVFNRALISLLKDFLCIVGFEVRYLKQETVTNIQLLYKYSLWQLAGFLYSSKSLLTCLRLTTAFTEHDSSLCPEVLISQYCTGIKKHPKICLPSLNFKKKLM